MQGYWYDILCTLATSSYYAYTIYYYSQYSMCSECLVVALVSLVGALSGTAAVPAVSDVQCWTVSRAVSDSVTCSGQCYVQWAVLRAVSVLEGAAAAACWGERARFSFLGTIKLTADWCSSWRIFASYSCENPAARLRLALSTGEGWAGLNWAEHSTVACHLFNTVVQIGLGAMKCTVALSQ
jgi:hypothetical protein